MVSAPVAGRRHCLYRYGNFCYVDDLSLSPVENTKHLPRLLKELQAVQSKMTYLAEVDHLGESTDEGIQLAKLNLAVDFIIDEVTEADSIIEDAMEGNNWVNSDATNLYFEFECRQTYKCHNADIIICKKYVASVIMTIILFQQRFFVTLSDASAEQNLVDSKFMSVHGKNRGFQVQAYDHPWFAKLSLWESALPGGAAEAEEDTASTAAAEALASATFNLTGDGYTQTYIVMRPKNLKAGSTARNVFFRFGGWCYSGQVDLGVDTLHLGDVPEVLPALQRQQSMLAFTCETSAVPATSPYAPILQAMSQAMGFFEAEIVASEEHLSKMAELGVTSWIEEDWGAAFFELAVSGSSIFDDVELIAAKTYSRGIVLHSVLFNNSLYAVLADADDDQPLLDVAFPDVTARCRGLQIKTYSLPQGDGLTPRKLGVWEGRRRGAIGVGWGTAAALAAAGAAKPKDGSISKGLKSTPQKRKKAAAEAKVVDDEDEGKGDEGSKVVEDEEPSKVAEEPVKPKRSEAPRRAATGSSKGEEEEDSKTSSSSGSGVGSGSGAVSSPSRGGGDFGVRAPHHLKPMSMGGGKGRLGRLSNLGPVGKAAPWGKGGRPVLGKSVLK